ncbi:MAG TPA: hypothetical protein VMR86_22145 [Myxococcota bacterium]|nr:hypothetical protein [Myxococcota bacterium]
MRIVRLLAIAAALALLLAWLSPYILLRLGLPQMARNMGGSFEVTGALPAFPFGASASRVAVTREGHTLVLDDFRAVLSFSGPRLDARVAEGNLLVRGNDPQLKSGIVRLEGVALESLATVLTTPFGLRGRCDGVWRFGPDSSLEGTVTRGAVLVQSPAPVEVPFAQLVLSAARSGEDGDWKVNALDIQGPPLSGHASGTLGADQSLAFDIDIRELEEPVKGFMAMMHLPTEPLPLALQLQGSLGMPRLVQRAETAAASGR